LIVDFYFANTYMGTVKVKSLEEPAVVGNRNRLAARLGVPVSEIECKERPIIGAQKEGAAVAGTTAAHNRID